MIKANGIAILFAFFFTFSPLAASNYISPSISKNEVAKEIKEYILSHSLQPILKDHPTRFGIATVFEDSDTSTVYVLGTLEQAETNYLALFSIQIGWFWNKAHCVYLSTEEPTHPADIEYLSYDAEYYLAGNPSDYHIFIQKAEEFEIQGEDPLDSTIQKWTYFNEDETVAFIVVFSELPNGEIDLAMGLWPEEED